MKQIFGKGIKIKRIACCCQFFKSPRESCFSYTNIKISRGEENIFVWSFFLAIAQLAIDKDENYKWVKTIYIDDPISSLDDNNVIPNETDLR
jgi:wobble nucleotide-excising tRNase